MDLEAYFAGQVETDGGLRSWLGRWQDGVGPTRCEASMASAPEPASAALESSRRARRVETALREVGRIDAAVLAALHAPRPPAPGLPREWWVAIVMDETVMHALLDEEDLERAERRHDRLREALRSGTAEDARHAMELAPLPVTSRAPMVERLRALAAAKGPSARRLQRRLERAVLVQSADALRAFELAWRAAATVERRERERRFERALEGR